MTSFYCNTAIYKTMQGGQLEIASTINTQYMVPLFPVFFDRFLQILIAWYVVLVQMTHEVPGLFGKPNSRRIKVVMPNVTGGR